MYSQPFSTCIMAALKGNWARLGAWWKLMTKAKWDRTHTDIDSSEPKSKLVYTFPGNWCGVPTVVGHYLVQSVPAVHGFIVLDIAHADRPKEVSRLTLSDTYGSHWTGWDPKTERLVVTPYKTAADRTYLLKVDQTTGALTVDADFRDSDGQPGFSFADREWPHGWKGAGAPHGAVFTR
jgi:hypothetical protein